MSINPMLFILLTLATFRISHMVAMEEGPWHLFERLHLLLGAKVDITGQHWTAGNNVLAKLMSCPLCLSVWVGLVLAVVFVRGSILDVLLVAVAASGASSALEMLVGGGR